MTLNELIKKIPIDHHDSQLVVEFKVINWSRNETVELRPLEFHHIDQYGMDTSKIVLKLEKDR